jgi:hypothetical protein
MPPEDWKVALNSHATEANAQCFQSYKTEKIDPMTLLKGLRQQSTELSEFSTLFPSLIHSFVHGFWTKPSYIN